MHLLFLATFIATISASSLQGGPRGQILRRGTGCGSLGKTTTEVAGATVTLTGPFDLSASAPGQPFDGKLAVSAPPDGSCCSNFFIFGIPADRASTNAASFYLNGDQLVSIQDGALWTAYDGDTSDPINSHVLLGSGDDLTSNPVVSCGIDSESCALSCTAPGGFAYNCLASPGYQPDWRLAISKDGAGPGCVEFTPIAIPVAGSQGNNGGSALPSGSASASASGSASSAPASSSSALASSSSTGKKKKFPTKTTFNTVTAGAKGGPAMSAGASSSSPPQSANFALRTAAPAVLANAAIVGLLAAL